jgi:hypothetical protein
MRPTGGSLRRCWAAGAVALTVAFVPVSGALAQGTPGSPLTPSGGGSPLSPLTPAPPQIPTTPTTVAPTTNTSGGTLTGTDAILIAVGALVVLGGIAFFIWYDARRRAPVRQRTAEATAGGPGGTRPRPKNRKLSPAERRRRKRGRAR